MLTLNLSQNETSRWASEPALRSEVRAAAKAAAKRNARFYRITGAAGQELCCVEI